MASKLEEGVVVAGVLELEAGDWLMLKIWW